MNDVLVVALAGIIVIWLIFLIVFLTIVKHKIIKLERSAANLNVKINAIENSMDLIWKRRINIERREREELKDEKGGIG